MSALLGVEIRRLAARRLVRAAAALVLLGIVIAGIVTFARSHRPDPAARAAAQIQLRQSVQDCMRAVPPQNVPPGETVQHFCQENVFFEADQGFQLASLDDIFKGVTVPLALLAWVLAASLVGAEWHAGTMGTLLTWEPRRSRVLASKAIVCVAFGFVATVVFLVILGGVLYPAAVFRGTTVGADAAWFREIAGVLVRCSALAAAAAALGFAIAAVARGSAAAMGVGFGYILVVENLVGTLRPGWRSWMFVFNAVIFVDGQRHPEIVPHSVVEAGVLLAVYGLGSIAIALAVFARRDVT